MFHYIAFCHKNMVLILSLLIMMLISSCEYEPKGTYMVDLTKPGEAPPLDVELNLVTDTIYFYWSSAIRLKLNEGNTKILSVKSYMDDKEVYGYPEGTTYITPVNFTQPGSHKFRIVITTSSGSGSIADILGAEGFQYNSREWTLIAQNVNTLNMTYQLDATGLSFTWKEYDGIDIKSYRLKELATRNSYDIQANYFYNSDYAGEQSYYEVYVVDTQDKEHLWGRCNLNKSLPVLRLSGIDNKIALTWNKSPFAQNISEYQVFQKTNAGSWTKTGTVSKNDTLLLLNIPENVFAPMLSFYLYGVPAKSVYIDNTSLFSSFLNNVNVALPGPKFDTNVGADCSGFYYYNYSSSLRKHILYRYTSSTDQSAAVSDYQFAYDISPNAKYLLITRDSIVDLFSLSTNSVVKSVNMRNIAPTYYFSAYPKISDNGICAFYSSNVIYVYDILNGTLIGTSKSSYSDYVRISASGKYVAASRTDSIKTYRVDSNSVTFISGFKTAVSREFDFLPDQDEYLYLYVSPVMSVISCLDFSSVRNMNIGPYFFNIDFCSHKILTAKDGSNWNIYDFNTGSLLQTIRTEKGTGGSNYTLLNNNTIYYTGYKYFLAD